MLINDSNGTIINSREVRLHDDVLNQLIFDRQKRELNLLISKELRENDMYMVKFVSVIGFDMTACDFWGASPHILDFEYIEPAHRILLPQLYERSQKYESKYSVFSTDGNYIETVMTFSSGDQLRIVSEYLIIYNN